MDVELHQMPFLVYIIYFPSLITDKVNNFNEFQNPKPPLQIELDDGQTIALQAFVKMNISEVHHKV